MNAQRHLKESKPLNRVNEKYTIIVTPRERFSITGRCLDHVIRTSPEPYDLIVVMGGMPNRLRNQLVEKYQHKGRFILEDEFMNEGYARTCGLKATKTRLAIMIDNDCRPWPNWVEPLLACQKDMNAVMVAPVILEHNDEVHTAYNYEQTINWMTSLSSLYFRIDTLNSAHKTFSF